MMCRYLMCFQKSDENLVCHTAAKLLKVTEMSKLTFESPAFNMLKPRSD